MSRTVQGACSSWLKQTGGYLAGVVAGVVGFATDGYVGAVMAGALGLVALVVAVRTIYWCRLREEALLRELAHSPAELLLQAALNGEDVGPLVDADRLREGLSS